MVKEPSNNSFIDQDSGNYTVNIQQVDSHAINSGMPEEKPEEFSDPTVNENEFKKIHSRSNEAKSGEDQIVEDLLKKSSS